MTGHAAHDDAFYVPKELFEEWAAKDPIARLAGYLTTRGVATEAELREVEARVVREVDEAIAWAEQSPYPDPEECLEGVYAPPTS
jgi:pyruvate dehydrogenase E1 component alpha subunit